MNGEHYYLKNGLTLQNKLRITDRAELERATEKVEQDGRKRILASGDYHGLAGLLTIHKQTYGKLFRWAGKYRTADIDGNNLQYDPAAFVQANLEYIFERYDQAKTTGSLDRGLLGEVLFYLAVAHPFWNGNRFTENLWLEINHPNVLERPRALETARAKALLARESFPLCGYLTKITL
tara:strand:+ start:592 stop:1128 length:537 start_codon:yes stop_codon:yes gene_type:complete